MSNDEDFINLEAIFFAFRRRFALFLASSALVFALVVVVTMQATPMFTSVASVIIDPEEREVTDFESALAGRAPDSAMIDTEVEIIKSRALLERVVKKINLIEDPEFNKRLRQPTNMAVFKMKIKDSLKDFLPKQVAIETSEESIVRITKESVTNNLASHLQVYREGLTYVIKVAVTSESPKKAAQIANAVAEEYLVEQLEAKFESTSRSNNWLSERLSELRDDVRSSENAVELYRAQSGLLSAQGSSLTEQQISDLNAQLIIQSAEYNEARARLESVQSQISRGLGADTIGEVLSSSTIIQLRGKQSEIAGRKAELSSRYGARHPDILKIDREAADVSVQIQQAVERVVASLENEMLIAKQKVDAIETGLRGLRGELSSNNRSLVRLRELERDADANKTLYESFLGRFKETGEQGTLAKADARIASRAALPIHKSSPNTLLNIVLGVLLGGLTGVSLVALMELLDNGLSTGAQVERTTGLPFIASIPLIGDGIIQGVKKLTGGYVAPHDYIAEKPLSSFAESYRTIRSSLLLSNVDKPPKIIAITSALPGDGKTVSAISLGRLSAISGSKTIMIDCDLRRRSLSKAITSAKHGLLGYLSGDVSFDDVIITDTQTSCDILPLTESKFTPRDIFGSKAFAKLLAKLESKYDLIVLDTAPILPVAETRTLANLSDAVVFAAKWRSTKKDALSTAVRIAKDAGANVVGTVLTQVNLRKRGRYGSGDYGYYHKAYRKYYLD